MMRHHWLRQIVVSGIAVVLLSRTVTAADKSRITLTAGSQRHDFEGGRLARDYADLESQLGTGTFDDRASYLLPSAERFTRTVFNLTSLSSLKAVTYRDSSGDCLLMEWHFAEEFGYGSVILQDTPRWSIYQFRFPGNELSTPEGIRATLERLVAWEVRPTRLTKLTINPILRNATVLYFDSAPIDMVPRAFVGYLGFVGTNTKSGSFLEVRFGKLYTELTGGEYPVPPFVPQRFPPLSELIQGWSFEQIANELNSRAFPHLSTAPSDYRNKVLVSELLRRGIDEDHLLRILTPDDGRDYEGRLVAVIAGCGLLGKEQVLDAAIPRVMALYRQRGRPASIAAEHLFMYAGTRCSESAEAVARETFVSGDFQSGALRYLALCSRSRDVLEEIERNAGADVTRLEKERAAILITNRLTPPAR